MTIVSKPDPEYPGPLHRHLWLLVGDSDYSDCGYAFYLGADSDIDGDPIADDSIGSVIQHAKSKGISLTAHEIRQILIDYRSDRDNDLY